MADKAALMLPPPPRPPRSLAALALPGDVGTAKAVLPEEDYQEGLAAIIERDYFPDIPKLRSQLEWAQAIKSGDPNVIKQAQINIARRRAGLMTPALQPAAAGAGTPSVHSVAAHGGATPSGWGVTPAMPATMQTPAMTPMAGAPGSATPSVHGNPEVAGAGQVALESELKAPPMSLDTFVATHTSEDNASFARIHAKDMIRKKRRVVHHLEDKNQPLLLTGPDANPTDGFGTGSQQPMTLVHTRHNPTNTLYYVPDQKPLSAAEAEHIGARPTKAINLRGTRLKTSESDTQAGSAAGAGGAQQGAGVGAGGGGPGGEFSRLSTPAFTPGQVGESPLMTWGDIASTPLRIDGEDLLAPGAAGVGGGGPAFMVPAQPKREATAHQLATMKSLTAFKNKQREERRAQQLMAALPPGAGASVAAATPRTGSRLVAGGATPTPGRPGTGGGAGAAGMSEAALKLARQLKEKQKRAGTGGRTPAAEADVMLRASYSAQRARTPAVVGGVMGAGGATPKVAARATPAGGAGKSITDDLLHI